MNLRLYRTAFAAIAAALCMSFLAPQPLAARDAPPLEIPGRQQGAPSAVPSPNPTVNPNEDFARQFEALKKQLEALGGQIKKSAGEIEALTSPDSARRQIATLQSLIANTLGMVANNGDVARLGEKVMDYARRKQKEFETDKQFSPEERAYLQKEWKRVGAQTEAAIQDLTNARAKLT
ncbi:MAG: hypothetical protein AB7J19_19045, partial [Beijerinckiaceae bacterium]